MIRVDSLLLIFGALVMTRSVIPTPNNAFSADSTHNKTEEKTETLKAKRAAGLLTQKELLFKLKIVVDREAVKLAERYLEEEKAFSVVKDMASTVGLFIQESFKSLRKSVRINCEISQVEVLKSPIKKIKTMSEKNDKKKVCGEAMLEELYIFCKLDQTSVVDHVLFLTGYQLRDKSGQDIRNIVVYDEICTKQSISLMHFRFEMHFFLRLAARTVIQSMGVRFDEKKTERYIMSKNIYSVYANNSISEYSAQSRQQLRSFLAKMDMGSRFPMCLLQPKRGKRLNPVVDIGARFDDAFQCKFVDCVIPRPHRVQPPTKICEEGIICKCAPGRKVIDRRVLPFLGTPCNPADVTYVCRWKKCVAL